MSHVELSVVIPVRDEAPSIGEMHRELTETLDAWGRDYEIIVVDDGSTDDSFEKLARLQAIDPHLRLIGGDSLASLPIVKACVQRLVARGILVRTRAFGVYRVRRPGELQ